MSRYSKRLIGSRSKSIAALIRKIVARRQANTIWLESYVPNYRRRIRMYEQGEKNISFDSFIDLMTALRCQVIVVPVGNWGEWYILNDFPDNDGNVLKMPEEVLKGNVTRHRTE